MGTFFILGKSSAGELKEISLKYKGEFKRVVNGFGGDVRFMYVMLRGEYLVFVFAFPGLEKATKASLALSKLTGISFQISPAVPVDEFHELVT